MHSRLLRLVVGTAGASVRVRALSLLDPDNLAGLIEHNFAGSRVVLFELSGLVSKELRLMEPAAYERWQDLRINDHARRLGAGYEWLIRKFYGRVPADLGEMFDWLLCVDVKVLLSLDDAGDVLERCVLITGHRPIAADRDTVRLVDLTMAGRKIALVWHKRRFMCREPECDMKSFTQRDPRICAPRMRMSDRCARWVTLKVGRDGLHVSALARELGCDWYTVNDAVLSYGAALVSDRERFSAVEFLGLDETAFRRVAPY